MKELCILFILAILFSCQDNSQKDKPAPTQTELYVDDVKNKEWTCIDKMINAKYQADKSKVLEVLKSNCDFSNSMEELKEVLLWASKHNFTTIIKTIIDFGVDPNIQQNKTEKTLLANAVTNKDILLIKYLLSKGVKIEITFPE